jgi:hypothetical protein
VLQQSTCTTQRTLRALRPSRQGRQQLIMCSCVRVQPLNTAILLTSEFVHCRLSHREAVSTGRRKSPENWATAYETFTFVKLRTYESALNGPGANACRHRRGWPATGVTIAYGTCRPAASVLGLCIRATARGISQTPRIQSGLNGKDTPRIRHVSTAVETVHVARVDLEITRKRRVGGSLVVRRSLLNA